MPDLLPELISVVVAHSLALFDTSNGDEDVHARSIRLDRLLARQEAFLSFMRVSKLWYSPALREGSTTLLVQSQDPAALGRLASLLDREEVKGRVKVLVLFDHGEHSAERELLMEGMDLRACHLIRPGRSEVREPVFFRGVQLLPQYLAAKSQLRSLTITIPQSIGLSMLPDALAPLPGLTDLTVSAHFSHDYLSRDLPLHEMRLRRLQLIDRVPPASMVIFPTRLLQWLLANSGESLEVLSLPIGALRREGLHASMRWWHFKKVRALSVDHLDQATLLSLGYVVAYLQQMTDLGIRHVGVDLLADVIPYLNASRGLTTLSIYDITSSTSLSYDEQWTFLDGMASAAARARERGGADRGPPIRLLRLPREWEEKHDAGEWAKLEMKVAAI